MISTKDTLSDMHLLSFLKLRCITDLKIIIEILIRYAKMKNNEMLDVEYISDLLWIITFLIGCSREGITYLLHKYLVTYYVQDIILSSGNIIGSKILFQFF